MSLRSPGRPSPATPAPAAASGLRADLDALRAELADLAFTLERRGRLDAADVVMTISNRIGTLCSIANDPGADTSPTPDPVRAEAPRSL